MIVDDDLMVREVLTLLAAGAGFEVTAFEDGESALEKIAAGLEDCPGIVLVDMQMPGLSGDSFARLLRGACGPATKLLAMSGSKVAADRILAFDGFLLKPFSFSDVLAVLEDSTQLPAPRSEAETVLNRTIYDSFASGMSADQLARLYDMSLDDADARIDQMYDAIETGDEDSYRRAAHSIKGGCGMVGAIELAGLAAAMEEQGFSPVDDKGPLKQFLTASAHLRRILDALRK